jgi:hypothetical protein
MELGINIVIILIHCKSGSKTRGDELTKIEDIERAFWLSRNEIKVCA